VIRPSLLLAPILLAAASASAQTTYLSSDRTITAGNPFNASSGTLFVGETAGGTAVTGVDVDIVAGASVVGNLVARSDSRTTVWAGSFQSGVNGFPFSGLTLSQSAAVRLNGDVSFGYTTVSDQAHFTMDAGRIEGITVSGGRGTINGGLVASQNSFTIMQAEGIGALLELNGGVGGGAVRVAGNGLTRVTGGNYAIQHALNGMIEISGGLPAQGARLVALNRLGAVGEFTLVGTGFALSNPTAGSYYDPSYLISQPGVSFRLTGTLANGLAIDASYFEEGLLLGQSPTQIDFISSAVPEPASMLLMLLAAPVMFSALRRRTGGHVRPG
jgi:hypothetical protein